MDGWMDGWMDGLDGWVERLSPQKRIIFLFFHQAREHNPPSSPLFLYHLFSRIIDKKIEIFQLDLA